MATRTLNTLLKEAGELLEKHEFDAAAERYREANARQPGNAAAAMGMAMVYNRTGQPEEALLLLDNLWKTIKKSRAKSIAVSKAAILAQKGLANEQLGRREEALEKYREAQALHSSQELTDRINRLEHQQPVANSPDQLALVGHRLLRSGKIPEAEKLFHAALKLNPDYPPALHGLGLALRARKDYNGALPLLQQAIILDPEKPNYYNDLGMLFQDRGELEKAISFHKRAIKVNSDFVPAHINLGVAYKRLNRIEEAIEAYRHAIILDPDAAAAHNNLGNLLRLQGDLAGARKHINLALKINPAYNDAQKNLEYLNKDEQAKT